jgi:hypothetical protein
MKGSVVMLLLLAVPAEAQTFPEQPGIWRGRFGRTALPREHAARLEQSLRRISGFEQLRFREDGALSLGDPSASGAGAPTARGILMAAADSGMAFVVEDHSGSSLVQFAQLDAGTNLEDDRCPERRLVLWRVRIDFQDFRRFDAPAAVRDAFDPGFALLHELLHGLGYDDASQPNDVGAVERVLNRARVELGLPQRDSYFAEALPVANLLLSVRLRFRAAPLGAKGRAQYLVYLVDARGARLASPAADLVLWLRTTRASSRARRGAW